MPPGRRLLDLFAGAALRPSPTKGPVLPFSESWSATTDAAAARKQSIGSGGGIKQIEAKTVTFGATDAPLKGPELDKFGLVQFPMVMGGIVPVINLDGVAPGELVLDGPTLAAIFLGTVKSWDDPAIRKLNPTSSCPRRQSPSSTALMVLARPSISLTTWLK